MLELITIQILPRSTSHLQSTKLLHVYFIITEDDESMAYEDGLCSEPYGFTSHLAEFLLAWDKWGGISNLVSK